MNVGFKFKFKFLDIININYSSQQGIEHCEKYEPYLKQVCKRRITFHIRLGFKRDGRGCKPRPANIEHCEKYDLYLKQVCKRRITFHIRLGFKRDGRGCKPRPAKYYSVYRWHKVHLYNLSH